jgi:hypothetical protein
MTCNLRCKLCILDAPYYKNSFHPDIQYVKDVTDRSFLLGNYEIFEFNGGEPLLRRDFAEIWDYAYKYIENVNVFKTVTNGTLIPDDDLIAVWRKYGSKFYCIVDDYGEEKSPAATVAVDKLRKAGIPCEKRDMYTTDRHHGGWADFRVSDPLHNETESEGVYLSCGQSQKLKHCCNIINGLLMPCHMQFKLNDRGICSPLPFEFIDLFDDTEPIEDKRKKMNDFTDITKIKSLSACRYCIGFSEGIARFEPAVQLTRDELARAPKIDKSKGIY